MCDWSELSNDWAEVILPWLEQSPSLHAKNADLLVKYRHKNMPFIGNSMVFNDGRGYFSIGLNILFRSMTYFLVRTGSGYEKLPAVNICCFAFAYFKK